SCRHVLSSRPCFGHLDRWVVALLNHPHPSTTQQQDAAGLKNRVWKTCRVWIRAADARSSMLRRRLSPCLFRGVDLFYSVDPTSFEALLIQIQPLCLHTLLMAFDLGPDLKKRAAVGVQLMHMGQPQMV